MKILKSVPRFIIFYSNLLYFISFFKLIESSDYECDSGDSSCDFNTVEQQNDYLLQRSADPTLPPNRDIKFGVYLPSWNVYSKMFMGLSKLNLNGVSSAPSVPEWKYSFWARDMRALANKMHYLNYAFWNVNSDCIVQDSDTDASWYGAVSEPTWINIQRNNQSVCKGMMNDMMSLKNDFPHLKLLVTLGGLENAKNLSKCSSTQENREKIAKSLNFLLKQMDSNWGMADNMWAGVDIIKEYSDSVEDSEWENYVSLIKTIRQIAHNENRHEAIISSAFGVGAPFDKLISTPHIVKDLCESVDFVNLKAYNFHGQWDKITGHAAPFCEDKRTQNPTRNSVVSIVDKLTAAGCPAIKLHLGIPSFAQVWTSVERGPHGNGLFTAASGDFWKGWSTYSQSETEWEPQGTVSFWDIKREFERNADLKEYVYECPENYDVAVPIKHIYSEQRKIFASYEDENTVEHKAIWAKTRGLGGIFFWEAENDRKGHLLNAARIGFDVSKVNPAKQNTNKCFDDRKIDYTLNPLTGEKIREECQFTNHSLNVISGDTCAKLRHLAKTACGDYEAFVIGSHRQGETECLHLCTRLFGEGMSRLNAGDTIYYACDNEVVSPEAGIESRYESITHEQDSVTGNHCSTCDDCVAVPGNFQAATDAHCKPCARNKQSWWPCSDPGLCQFYFVPFG